MIVKKTDNYKSITKMLPKRQLTKQLQNEGEYVEGRI